MVHACVCDHPFEVGLREGDKGTVEGGKDRDDCNKGRGNPKCAGSHLQREAHKAVGAKLEQHAGENHAACRRCLDMCEWQPRVEGKQRRFHREADQQGNKGQPRSQARQWRRGDGGTHVECARGTAEIQCQNREQHRQAAEQSVQKEGEGGPPTLLRVVPPPRDDEVHTDE